MIREAKIYCWSLLLLIPLTASGGDRYPAEFALSSGKSFSTKSNINLYRLSLGGRLFESKTLGENWRLESHWETSIADLRTDVPDCCNYSRGHEETLVGALSPVFRLRAPGHFHGAARPYLEFGIGAAWFQHKTLAAYDYSEGELGSHLQFEDRIAIGLELPRWPDVSIKFSIMHYSNANLGDTNDGINLRMLSISLPLR